MDNDFYNIPDLKWFPFIGAHFFEIPENNRMLVVGESHYHNNSEQSILKHENPQYTKIVIDELAINRMYWDTKIFPNFHKTLFKNDNFDSATFWNQVSFYNFIQRTMETNKNRPSSKEFLENWKTFFGIIKVLKPRVCLFIGNTAANQLMKAIQNSEFECNEVKWETNINGAYGKIAILKGKDNLEIKLIFIKHTSQRYTWQKWNVFLTNNIGKQITWFEEKLNEK